MKRRIQSALAAFAFTLWLVWFLVVPVWEARAQIVIVDGVTESATLWASAQASANAASNVAAGAAAGLLNKLNATNGTARSTTLLDPIVGTNGIVVQGYVEVPTTNVLIFTAGESQYWPEGTNWNGTYSRRSDGTYTNVATGKVWMFTGWTGPKGPGEMETWIAGWHDGSGLNWWASQDYPQLSEEGSGTTEGEPPGDMNFAPTNTPTIAPWGSGSVNIGPGGSPFTISRGTTQTLTTVTLTYNWATAIAATLDSKLSTTGGVISGTVEVGYLQLPTGTAYLNLAIATNLYTGAIWDKAGTTKVVNPDAGTAAFTGAVTGSTFRATGGTLTTNLFIGPAGTTNRMIWRGGIIQSVQ